MNPKRKMMRAERERKARIRRIRNDNTLIVRAGRGRHTVRLKIDHQQFQIADMGSYTAREAHWTATMLAIALNRFKHGD